MSTIADIISALGGRRGRNAMYREEPIYGAPAMDETLDMPGLDEEIGPDGKRRIVAGGSESSTFKVPGEVRQVGSKPARLSRLGSILNAIPDLARGAMAGVMAPTTNSGLDFVAGAQAAGDDKERRDALEMNRRRQVQQDRMNAELHQSQIEENRAQGRRADAQAQLAMQPKLGKQAGPDLSAQITALIGQGYSKEEAASIVMKQWDPRLAAGAKPVANYEAEVANEIRKLDPKDPNYPTLRKALEDKLIEWKKTAKPLPRIQLFPGTVEGKAMRVNPDGTASPLTTKDGKDVTPDKKTSNPRPFKDTAADKGYRDKRSISQGIAYVANEAKQKGYPPEVVVANVLNPAYYKGIPEVDQFRREIADYFTKQAKPQKSGNVFSPGARKPAVTQQKPADPLGIR